MTDAATDAEARTVPELVALLAVAATGLGLLVYSNALHYSYFAPKLACLLFLGGLGALFLSSSSLPRVPHLAVLALLTWGLLSTLLNGEPGLSFWGHANWGTGWLFTLCCAAAWALAHHLDERKLRLLAAVVVVAAVGNLLASLAIVTWDLSSFNLGRVAGRPAGLLGNPIHVGAVMAAGLPLVERLSSRWWVRAPLLFLLSVGLGLSGSRGPIGLAVLVVGGWSLLHLGWRRGLLTVALIIGGVAAAEPIASSGGGVSAGSRVAAGTAGTLGERQEVWEASAGAIAERPLMGRGPGRFHEATSTHRTADFARRHPDLNYLDAHNLLINTAVTFGIPGSLALAVFLIAAFRAARGPFAVAAVVLFGVHLVQPQAVGLTPLLFITLGAAGPRAVRSWRRPVVAAGIGAPAALGALAGVALIAGSYYVRQSELDQDVGDADRALRLLPPWPEVAQFRGLPAVFVGGTENPAAVEEAHDWFLLAIDRSPEDPRGYRRIIGYEVNNNLVEDAERHLDRLLEVDPRSKFAHKALAELAARRGDIDEAVRQYEIVVETWSTDQQARAALERLRAAQASRP
jgi:O-antigen ligase